MIRTPAEADIIVGQNLKAIRTARGISQTEIGIQLGVSFQQIQRYEKGKNRISAGKLWRCAEFFQTQVADFYEGLGEKEVA